MSQLMSLADAVAATIRDGDTVAMEGFTHLIPTAAGHEVIRQRRKDLTSDPHDAGHHLRPAHRDGLRQQVDVFVGGQSRRRLAAPVARRDRECLAQSGHLSGTFPCCDGECLRGRRGGTPVCDLPRLHWRRSAEGEPDDQAYRLSVHRREARGDPRRSGRTLR